MQCTLMNFDDRTRVVYNTKNQPVVMEIGDCATTDLHEEVVMFILRAQAMDDPLVLVKGIPEKTAELVMVMDLLRDMNTTNYAEILVRATELFGAERLGNVRPTLEHLRGLLRKEAQRLADDVKIDELEVAERPQPEPIVPDDAFEDPKREAPPPDKPPAKAPKGAKRERL